MTDHDTTEPYATTTDPWGVWRFQARLVRVVDGDTVDVTADLGFKTRRTIRLRLIGVDTAEIFGVPHDSDEYQTGIEQAQFVKDWLADAPPADGERATRDAHDWPLVVRTETETGKYGRYIADVQRKVEGDWLVPTLLDEYPDVARTY